MYHIGIFFHDQCGFGCLTDVGAVAAAQAIQRRYLYPVLVFVQVFAGGLQCVEAVGGLHLLFLGQQHWADGRMRADKGTLVTLDTFIRLPLRHMGGYATFLISRCAGGEGAVFHACESADRQVISLTLGHGQQYLVDEFRQVSAFFLLLFQKLPVLGDGDADHLVNAAVHRLTVHGNDFFTFFTVGFFNSFF